MCVCAQVKFTGYRDRPVEERRRRFVEDLHEGHSVIVSHLYPYRLLSVSVLPCLSLSFSVCVCVCMCRLQNVKCAHINGLCVCCFVNIII